MAVRAFCHFCLWGVFADIDQNCLSLLLRVASDECCSFRADFVFCVFQIGTLSSGSYLCWFSGVESPAVACCEQ